MSEVELVIVASWELTTSFIINFNQLTVEVEMRTYITLFINVVCFVAGIGLLGSLVEFLKRGEQIVRSNLL